MRYAYHYQLSRHQNRLMNSIQRLVDAELQKTGYNGVDIESVAIVLNMSFKPIIWLVETHGDKVGLYYSNYVCEIRRTRSAK